MCTKENLKVVVLHNQVSSESTQDERDVITQVNVVSEVLSDLGYEPVSLPISLNMQDASEQLKSINPKFVFNLVESIAGAGRFLYFAPALLDRLGYPYTGSGTSTLFLTTNKLLSKQWMRFNHISTPAWASIDGFNTNEPLFQPPYILKPVWEDASVGLDATSVFYNWQELQNRIKNNRDSAEDWFTENFISGREFNISILADKNKAQVLPVAEIEFIDYPADKPKIVDYRAKWEVESFEYQHTIRRFEYPAEDEPLLDRLRMLTRKCWKIFDLYGYARVDFRVDDSGKPWVLEINANPCISPDSGFVAAAEAAGLDFNTVIRRIIEDINNGG